MTRGKQLVAALVALLVVASGIAIAGATGAVNNVQQEEDASATFEDQSTDGTTVTVASVTVPEGGFVTIHDSSLREGDAFGSVVGTSEYLEPGTHEDVAVTLDEELSESETLIAMPHLDTNANQQYDFVETEGAEDGAYTQNEEPVVDDAQVSVQAVTEGEPTEVEENETDETDAPTEVEENETTEEVTEVEENETTEEVTEVEENETTEEVTEVEENETTEVETETETETEVEVDETETETETVTSVETPEQPDVETPDELVFHVEQMQIDEWSFVVGNDTEPDRTETVENVQLQDREVRLNVTELLTDEDAMRDALGEDAADDAGQSLDETGDDTPSEMETVRFVIRNVNVENVTFVLEMPDEREMEMINESVETPEAGAQTPAETPSVDDFDDEAPSQFFFVVEQMQIDRWSFVVGDETEPDTTERVGDVQLSDRNFTATSTELEGLLQALAMQQQQAAQATPTEDATAGETPEEVGDDDVETTRIVIENVDVRNVTFGVVEDGADGMDEMVTPEETGPPEDVQPGQAGAQVEFSDQSSDGQTVTVDRVTLSQGGFVTIHDSSLLEGDAFGSVVGTSEYLERGTHRNVEVTLSEELSESETLIAMPHLDTNANQQYDFVDSQGQEDGPYIRGNQPVVDDGQVTVDGADAGATGADEGDGDEGPTETETEVGTEDAGDDDLDGLNGTETETEGGTASVAALV